MSILEHQVRTRLCAPLGLLAAVSCSATPPVGAPVAPPVTVTLVEPAKAAEPAPPPLPDGTTTVVVRALRAASRTNERPRVLARIAALRQGKLQLARRYSRVNLFVAEVVEGRLDDPDYARRPVGVNVLPVVLLDEAADAAGDSLQGFEGRWRLTRLPDGTLIVSAIADTPWPAERAAARQKEHERIAQGLDGADPAAQLEVLGALERHAFLDLVPRVLTLAGKGMADVAPAARARLGELLAPFADDTAPPDDRSPEAWGTWWRAALARPPFPAPEPAAPGEPITHLRVTMNQTDPYLDASPSGGRTLVGVSRLQTPIDGFANGFALLDPGGARRWAHGVAPAPPGESREPSGPLSAWSDGGVAVVWHESDEHWHVAFAASAGRSAPARKLDIEATHTALAPADGGWALAFARPDTDEKQGGLWLSLLDPGGRPRGAPRKVPTPQPIGWQYHDGVHPLSLARTREGHVLVLEQNGGLALMGIGADQRVRWTKEIRTATPGAFPAVAASTDRVLVRWTRDDPRARVLLAQAFGLDGAELSGPERVAPDVDEVSPPVALPGGGFAVAWTQDEREVRVARWNAIGRLHPPTLVHRGQPRNAPAVGADGDGLRVLFVDGARYPFALSEKRVPR